MALRSPLLEPWAEAATSVPGPSLQAQSSLLTSPRRPVQDWRAVLSAAQAARASREQHLAQLALRHNTLGQIPQTIRTLQDSNQQQPYHVTSMPWHTYDQHLPLGGSQLGFLPARPHPEGSYGHSTRPVNEMPSTTATWPRSALVPEPEALDTGPQQPSQHTTGGTAGGSWPCPGRDFELLHQPQGQQPCGASVPGGVAGRWDADARNVADRAVKSAVPPAGSGQSVTGGATGPWRLAGDPPRPPAPCSSCYRRQDSDTDSNSDRPDETSHGYGGRSCAQAGATWGSGTDSAGVACWGAGVGDNDLGGGGPARAMRRRRTYEVIYVQDKVRSPGGEEAAVAQRRGAEEERLTAGHTAEAAVAAEVSVGGSPEANGGKQQQPPPVEAVPRHAANTASATAARRQASTSGDGNDAAAAVVPVVRGAMEVPLQAQTGALEPTAVSARHQPEEAGRDRQEPPSAPYGSGVPPETGDTRQHAVGDIAGPRPCGTAAGAHKQGHTHASHATNSGTTTVPSGPAALAPSAEQNGWQASSPAAEGVPVPSAGMKAPEPQPVAPPDGAERASVGGALAAVGRAAWASSPATEAQPSSMVTPAVAAVSPLLPSGPGSPSADRRVRWRRISLSHQGDDPETLDAAAQALQGPHVLSPPPPPPPPPPPQQQPPLHPQRAPQLTPQWTSPPNAGPVGDRTGQALVHVWARQEAGRPWLGADVSGSPGLVQRSAASPPREHPGALVRSRATSPGHSPGGRHRRQHSRERGRDDMPQRHPWDSEGPVSSGSCSGFATADESRAAARFRRHGGQGRAASSPGCHSRSPCSGGHDQNSTPARRRAGHSPRPSSRGLAGASPRGEEASPGRQSPAACRVREAGRADDRGRAVSYHPPRQQQQHHSGDGRVRTRRPHQLEQHGSPVRMTGARWGGSGRDDGKSSPAPGHVQRGGRPSSRSPEVARHAARHAAPAAARTRDQASRGPPRVSTRHASPAVLALYHDSPWDSDFRPPRSPPLDSVEGGGGSARAGAVSGRHALTAARDGGRTSARQPRGPRFGAAAAPRRTGAEDSASDTSSSSRDTDPWFWLHRASLADRVKGWPGLGGLPVSSSSCSPSPERPLRRPARGSSAAEPEQRHCKAVNGATTVHTGPEEGGQRGRPIGAVASASRGPAPAAHGTGRSMTPPCAREGTAPGPAWLAPRRLWRAPSPSSHQGNTPEALAADASSPPGPSGRSAAAGAGGGRGSRRRDRPEREAAYAVESNRGRDHGGRGDRRRDHASGRSGSCDPRPSPARPRHRGDRGRNAEREEPSVAVSRSRSLPRGAPGTGHTSAADGAAAREGSGAATPSRSYHTHGHRRQRVTGGQASPGGGRGGHRRDHEREGHRRRSRVCPDATDRDNPGRSDACPRARFSPSKDRQQPRADGGGAGDATISGMAHAGASAVREAAALTAAQTAAPPAVADGKEAGQHTKRVMGLRGGPSSRPAAPEPAAPAAAADGSSGHCHTAGDTAVVGALAIANAAGAWPQDPVSEHARSGGEIDDFKIHDRTAAGHPVALPTTMTPHAPGSTHVCGYRPDGDNATRAPDATGAIAAPQPSEPSADDSSATRTFGFDSADAVAGPPDWAAGATGREWSQRLLRGDEAEAGTAEHVRTWLDAAEGAALLPLGDRATGGPELARARPPEEAADVRPLSPAGAAAGAKAVAAGDQGPAEMSEGAGGLAAAAQVASMAPVQVIITGPTTIVTAAPEPPVSGASPQGPAEQHLHPLQPVILDLRQLPSADLVAPAHFKALVERTQGQAPHPAAMRQAAAAPHSAAARPAGGLHAAASAAAAPSIRATSSGVSHGARHAPQLIVSAQAAPTAAGARDAPYVLLGPVSGVLATQGSHGSGQGKPGSSQEANAGATHAPLAPYNRMPGTAHPRDPAIGGAPADTQQPLKQAPSGQGHQGSSRWGTGSDNPGGSSGRSGWIGAGSNSSSNSKHTGGVPPGPHPGESTWVYPQRPPGATLVDMLGSDGSSWESQQGVLGPQLAHSSGSGSASGSLGTSGRVGAERPRLAPSAPTYARATGPSSAAGLPSNPSWAPRAPPAPEVAEEASTLGQATWVTEAGGLVGIIPLAGIGAGGVEVTVRLRGVATPGAPAEASGPTGSLPGRSSIASMAANAPGGAGWNAERPQMTHQPPPGRRPDPAHPGNFPAAQPSQRHNHPAQFQVASSQHPFSAHVENSGSRSFSHAAARRGQADATQHPREGKQPVNLSASGTAALGPMGGGGRAGGPSGSDQVLVDLSNGRFLQSLRQGGLRM